MDPGGHNWLCSFEAKIQLEMFRDHFRFFLKIFGDNFQSFFENVQQQFSTFYKNMLDENCLHL